LDHAYIWIINNFVQSTMGKALNAVADNELAADAMTVDTRKNQNGHFFYLPHSGRVWRGDYLPMLSAM
jgi:branched-chain amino acid transport system permease protein